MKKKIGKGQKKVARSFSSSDCNIEWPNSCKNNRRKSDSQINLFKQLSLAFHPTLTPYSRQDRNVKSATSKKMSAKGGPSRPKAEPSTRIISEKTFSEFPLADSAVLNEIRDAEQTAKQAACQIAEMRDQIQALTQKDELTPAEMEELQKKQRDIVCKLTEFEDVTKKIQELVGLASITCKDLPGGNNANSPCSPRAPSRAAPDALPDLPRVIIPPFGGMLPAQVAQVMVCEQVAIQQVEGGGGGGWFQTAGCGQGQGQPTGGQTGCNGNNQQQQQPGCCQDNPGFNPAQNNPQSNCPEQSQDPNMNIVGQLTDKLDASYKIQEKLAQENKEMECERYQLQEELLSRDKQTEAICKQLESLQCELKLVSAENCDLKKQVRNISDQQKQPRASTVSNNNDKPLCKQSLAKDPICKMDLYKQMGLPLPMEGGPGGQSLPTKNFQLGDMDAVVGSMEEEVRAMQKELGAVQAERRSLDLQKKLLKCATPRPNSTFPVCKKQVEMGASTASAPQLEMPKPPTPPPPPPKPQPQCMRELENQLKELSQQYTQLSQDFNDKVAELSVLRVEADKFREEKKMLILKKDEDQGKMDVMLTRIKVLEEEKDKWSGSKDVMLDIEQQMIMFKQKYLEKQELEDEMKLLINEQSLQLDDYRNKYIKAQEIVEGQRRDMDLMQKNHLRFSEQLTKELKSAKEEFQKRLEELSRLPDILKTTQQKLQESQQMRIIAEQNVEQLTSTVEELKEKVEIMQMELDKSNLELAGQNKENEDDGKLKLIVSELEERVLEVERQLEGKRQHVVMLEGQIESMREEAARAVTRTKERCDVVRRGLQNQISDLELQLAQARASARAAQKDRDMVREKMECQVQKLTKNFEEAQNWVRCLQSHVGFLKTSNRDLEFPSQPVDCLPKAFQPIAID